MADPKQDQIENKIEETQKEDAELTEADIEEVAGAGPGCRDSDPY